MSSDFIRLVDGLEDKADAYLTLDDVRSQADASEVDMAIAEHVLLVDYRTRLDGTSVTLCRLNRRHPRVTSVTTWGS